MASRWTATTGSDDLFGSVVRVTGGDCPGCGEGLAGTCVHYRRAEDGSVMYSPHCEACHWVSDWSAMSELP